MAPLTHTRRSQFPLPSGGSAAVDEPVVLLVDRDARITHCAGDVLGCFGLDSAELVGRPLAGLLRSGGARMTARAVQRALTQDEPSTVLVRTHLSERRLELQVAPLMNERGVANRALVLASDPGGPRAEPRGEDAGRRETEVARLAAMVSHDLSEPLLLVRGYAELLAADAADRLTPDELQQLDLICRTARRMQGLVDALLHHGEVGSATIGHETVEMTQVVDDALAMLERHVAESGAVVRRGRLVAVQGDPRLLSVLVRNLLSNAMKFIGERPVVVDISCEPVPGGWRLEVADNGIGIPDHELSRIFEMFERVDRKRFRGFGIGLASVQRIAELHGGAVEVSSEVGVGTTFRVLLTTQPD